MNKALLVIDLQEVLVGEHHAKYFKYDPELVTRANEVIDNYNDGIVIYIRNVMKRNFINKFAPFKGYEGTPEIELVKGLHIVSDYCFDKYVGNALTNEKLVSFLKKQEITHLDLIGVDGAACVALTAIGACKLGFHVTLNHQAIGAMLKPRQQRMERKLLKLGATIK